MTTEARTRPPPARWWSLTSWRVYHQTRSTGLCPFCGAPLPKLPFPLFSLGIQGGVIWTYAYSCPECGQRNHPLTFWQFITATVGGTLAYVALVLFLLFAYGPRPEAVALLAFMGGVGAFCFVVSVRRGGSAGMFTAAMPLLVIAFPAYVLWPTIFPPGPVTVAAVATLPVHEAAGRQITAVISIHNTTGSAMDDVVIDWPDHDTASALDAHISTADWQLQRISADGEAMQLDPNDSYTLPMSLDSGESTAVKLLLRPLHPGRHRFRVGVSPYTTGPGGIPTVLSLAAIVHGKRIPPPPPPSYSVSMRATMTSQQVKGQAVPLRLVIHNTANAITNVHLDLSDAISLNSLWLPDNSDEDWGVRSVTLNGQAIDVPDDSDVGEYDLGPLAARHDMHVTVSLVPRIAGTSTLQVEVYYLAVSSKPLRTNGLRATIAS